ncbi:MAG: hypothetical protein U9Q66_00680 [Patescibacteria group bacterium]|nr:hypothetical protein [Patescibacteria group bacterium]
MNVYSGVEYGIISLLTLRESIRFQDLAVIVIVVLYSSQVKFGSLFLTFTLKLKGDCELAGTDIVLLLFNTSRLSVSIFTIISSTLSELFISTQLTSVLSHTTKNLGIDGSRFNSF